VVWTSAGEVLACGDNSLGQLGLGHTQPHPGLVAVALPAGLAVRDVNRLLGDSKSSIGDVNRVLGDSKSSIGDVNRVLGDSKSSIGDVNRVLGDSKSFIVMSTSAGGSKSLVSGGRSCWAKLRARLMGLTGEGAGGGWTPHAAAD
jgi:hypothetical protein